jgi:hypothetical protein
MVVKRRSRKSNEAPRSPGYQHHPISVNNIIFNMNNEPAWVYTLFNICDKNKDQKSSLRV